VKPLYSIVILTTSGFIDTRHGILDGPNCLIFLTQVIQELPEFFYFRASNQPSMGGFFVIQTFVLNYQSQNKYKTGTRAAFKSAPCAHALKTQRIEEVEGWSD